MIENKERRNINQ